MKICFSQLTNGEENFDFPINLNKVGGKAVLANIPCIIYSFQIFFHTLL